MAKSNGLIKKPVFRKLRGYAFDPSLSLNLDTVGINEITYTIPWEDLHSGPEGEYVKVVDRDPSCDAIYHPVDLNEKEILAQDGLTPSVSNPQFHQQMVYAVAMNTIVNFEKALGRKVLWNAVFDGVAEKYLQKLIIYPHAVRDVNAYYDPERRALLFGYFNADASNPDLHMPDSLVFSCLSHDIIAHETTHGILDGIFKHYMESTHLDVGAFHEAFADIVALFQHFTFPEALRHQISRTRGRFNAENLLGQLAVEFGIASGSANALRDFIGKKNEQTRAWSPIEPDVNAYQSQFEVHDRGAILVAAIFNAFINIYNSRTSDLIRIATNGTGELPLGNLNSDLVNRLSVEASKAASHILSMCIRALDYCPPCDINFGDYLRALITADADLVANDDRQYRIAFIDAFRKWGIFPEGISVLAEESLLYHQDDVEEKAKIFTDSLYQFLHDFKNAIDFTVDREEIFTQTKSLIQYQSEELPGLHHYFLKGFRSKKEKEAFESLTGLALSTNYRKLDIADSEYLKSKPAIEIHSVRLNNRVGPDNNLQSQVVITLMQQCGVQVTWDEKKEEYSISTFPAEDIDYDEEGCFIFRGGCSLIFDLDTNALKHVISKPILDMDLYHARKKKYAPNRKRAIMQYECTWGDYVDLMGFAPSLKKADFFKCLHQSKSRRHG